MTPLGKSKRPEEWAKETEVIIECYDGLDGGRATREETRKLLQERVESYLHQETKGLVRALKKVESVVTRDLSEMHMGINDRPILNNCVRNCRSYAQEALSTLPPWAFEEGEKKS